MGLRHGHVSITHDERTEGRWVHLLGSQEIDGHIEETESGPTDVRCTSRDADVAFDILLSSEENGTLFVLIILH